MNRTYIGNISELPENGVFVFGSNTEGRHGKGAAYSARLYFGAIHGQARGPQGRSYAIATKDLRKTKQPSVLPHEILKEIKDLYNYARKNPNKDFYISYTYNTKLLSGYTTEELCKLFAVAALGETIPLNIVFETEFSKHTKQHWLNINAKLEVING